MGIIKKYNSLKNYFIIYKGILKVFSTSTDAMKFIKILNSNKTNSELISFRLKETKGNPLFVRPNTTDAKVLRDTFIWKYHVPPFHLEENSTILDLGSNVGYTMAHYAYLYDNSKIIGVELDKSNCKLAQKNLEPIKNQCTIINAGIWSSNEIMSYGGDEEWGFKILSNSETSGSIRTVKAKTIDTILDDCNIENVDFMKIDIEGAEKEIFKNPEKWINRIKSIKMEIHPPATYEWCLNILEKYDFQCSKQENLHITAIMATKN